MAGKKEKDLSWLEEYQPGATNSASAKPDKLAWLEEYQPKPAPPPAKLNENGLPEGFVGPPSLQDDPNLKKALPSIDTANRLRSEGRTVTGIDKSGTISLAPLPGGEVRSVMTREDGKPPQVNTSAELADAARRPIRDDMKPTRAFVAGALDSATLGFGDEIAAATGSGDYTKERNLTRRLMNEEKAGDPGMALAGGVLGGMSLAPISAASTPVRMLAEGAAIGGTAALGSSEAELYGKDKQIGQAAWDVAKGAGIGLGGTAAVLGGQRVANAIRTAPERVLAKENQRLLDGLMHRFPKAQRDEMIGSLGGDANYLIQVVREDPALVKSLLAGEKVESGTILAAKAEAERRAFAASVAAAQAERGAIPAQGAVDFLDREAREKSMSLIPSANKTAKELAATASKIREEILPVEGRALVSKIIKKAGGDEKERVLRRQADSLAELERMGIGSKIDDPEAVASIIKAEKSAAGALAGEIRKQAGDIDLPKFAAAITKASHDLEKTRTAASALRFKDEGKAYVTELYRKYAPEMVTDTGAISYRPGQATPRISFDDARRELTDLSDVAYNKLVPATPQEKARAAIAGDTRTFLEEQAASKLPPELEKKFREANKRYSILSDLENAIAPASLEARSAPVAATIKPRTGTIDVADAIATRNEMNDEGAQRALGDLIESHLGKDAAGKIAAQEKRARAVEQMAKSLDYQARDTRSMINPGLRGISDETVGQVSKSAANMGVVGSAATANPAIIAAALALKLGVSGAPAKAAARLDQAVAAMVAASRKGADHKTLNKIGKLAGLSAEISNDVALTIAQRVAPTYVGKED